MKSADRRHVVLLMQSVFLGTPSTFVPDHKFVVSLYLTVPIFEVTAEIAVPLFSVCLEAAVVIKAAECSNSLSDWETAAVFLTTIIL